MQLNIEIVTVSKSEVPRKDGKGTYDVLEVIYKNEKDNKVDGKKLMGFAAPKEMFNRLLDAEKGDRFAVTAEKNDKGYWDWKEIATQTDKPAAAASPAAPSTSSVRSNYETAEERAQRQVYIIRQSSVSSAINFHQGKDVSLTEVLTTAKEIVDFVMGKSKTEGLAEMADDIPL